MIHKDDTSSQSIKEIHPQMKKILALAIGLGLVLGTVSFAQDKMDDSKKSTDKKSKKKKKSDTKTDDTKKM
jgi:hypothetical protein